MEALERKSQTRALILLTETLGLLMSLQEKIIKSEEDLEEGIKFLSQHDPILSNVIDREKIVLTKRDAGFSALLKTIISQQLSTLAAGKIWQRVVDNELNIQSNILKVNAETLLSLGLSRQKCSYALALAQDKLDYSILGEMDSNTVIKRLTEIKGIGQWTAQIYCMFSLARGDIFPSGDLALQEAIRGLFSLEKRPNIKEVDEISKRWTPWKTIAAIVLWDFYRQQKKREGVLW